MTVFIGVDQKQGLWRPFYSYMVSEHGEIVGKKGPLTKFVDKDGYYRVCFRIAKGKQKKIHLHRVVYMAFCGEIPPDMVCCHIDSNRTNNHYTNLKVATQKENINDKVLNGTWQAGDTHPNTVYPDSAVEMVQKVIADNPNLKLRELVKILDPLPKHLIFDIKRGKRKTREQRIQERLTT